VLLLNYFETPQPLEFVVSYFCLHVLFVCPTLILCIGQVFFFFQFCEVGGLVIVHKVTYLATGQRAH
jgi:hypothetical protein